MKIDSVDFFYLSTSLANDILHVEATRPRRALAD